MKSWHYALTAAVLFGHFSLATATPLAGEAEFIDPTNQSVGVILITGDLDTQDNSMAVAPFMFFGLQWFTQSVELLSIGTFTRPDGFGGTISATVSPGQLGAYMVFDWAGNVIPSLTVWDVNSSANGSSYTTIDSDSDGIAGHAFTVGPFVGFSVVYDFLTGDPPPDIDITVSATGGTTQECSETGGSTISLSAAIDLIGGAELGTIEWYVNGQMAGSGNTITPFLTLGEHSVEALASTTTGESGGNSLILTVRDTTPPVLTTGFVDQGGNPVNATSAGNFVSASITAIDTCDSNPVTEGTAVPVFAVSNGDIIKIQSGKVNTVELPTTAIELSATASDASGNSSSGMAVLSINH